MHKEETSNEVNCNTDMIAGERPPSVTTENKGVGKNLLLSSGNIDIANNLDLAKLIINQSRDEKTNESSYIYVAGLLYFYNNGVYKPVGGENFELQIRGQLNTIPKLNANQSKINEIIKNMKSEALYSGDEKSNFFTDKPTTSRYISMKNGILNLTKAIKGETEFIPHTPKFFTTSKLPYEFDANADCKIFKKILNKILPNPENQKMLQHWFGYHLLNTLSHQKMMILKGSGSNGKSVILLILRR